MWSDAGDALCKYKPEEVSISFNSVESAKCLAIVIQGDVALNIYGYWTGAAFSWNACCDYSSR